MLLSNAPSKVPLPWATNGNKNSIPEASQIPVTPGAASLNDGFPPLTMTPIASGGIPPSGYDLNGILFLLSAISRWQNAGAGFVYDSTFATDTNVNGYPKGARILRSDGLGYWLNTTDNNTTDPEASLSAAITAGWVPDFTSGAAAITMTNANVTLTALQVGHQLIEITGTLAANLQLIFPQNLIDSWIILNNTTGAYTITATTMAGTTVALVSGMQIVSSDGTNIQAIASPVSQALTSVKTQIFTSSGTYTPTAGMVYCEVIAVGGGGGGGAAGSGSANNSGGGGGGAGRYGTSIYDASSIGASQSVTIGSGGGSGVSGGTTSFGSLMSVGGGGAGAAGSSVGGGGGLGGNGGTGAFYYITGGDGNSGGNYTSSTGTGGTGGASFFGSGGTMSYAGRAYGSGGGGGGWIGGSNNGASGVVIVKEYISA